MAEKEEETKSKKKPRKIFIASPKMGTKSKAARARLANLPNKSSKPYKTTVEDASDSEDDHEWVPSPMPELDEISDSECGSEDGEDVDWDEEQDSEQRGKVFVLDIMDWDSDLEDSDGDGDEEEEEEICNDAALLTFSNVLQQAQEIAAAAERKQRAGKMRPRHYKGNSERTRRRFAATRKKLAANGQPSIARWFNASKRDDDDDAMVSDAAPPELGDQRKMPVASRVRENFTFSVFKETHRLNKRNYTKTFGKRKSQCQNQNRNAKMRMRHAPQRMCHLPRLLSHRESQLSNSNVCRSCWMTCGMENDLATTVKRQLLMLV